MEEVEIKAEKQLKAKLKFDTARVSGRVEDRYLIQIDDSNEKRLEIEVFSLGNPVKSEAFYEDGSSFLLTKKDMPRMRKAAWRAIWADKNKRS